MDDPAGLVEFNSCKVFGFKHNFGLPEDHVKIVVLANVRTIFPSPKILLCATNAEFQASDISTETLLTEPQDKLLAILAEKGRPCRDLCSYSVFAPREDGEYEALETSHFPLPYLPSDSLIFFQWKNVLALFNISINCYKLTGEKQDLPNQHNLNVFLGEGNPSFTLLLAKQTLPVEPKASPAPTFKGIIFELPCYQIEGIRKRMS